MNWIDGVLVSCGEGGVYGERMLNNARVWDPYRSKLAALYYKGGGVEITLETRVLYLGAAHGTTVSHVADYAEVVYAVEIAPRPMQDLLEVCRRRPAIVPVMADAARPETYAPLVETVDLLYQDVAHPGQVAIALANSIFLRPGGTCILMLKTRSIDVRRDPAAVLAGAKDDLIQGGLLVQRCDWLEPYHRDHAAVTCKRPESTGDPP